MLDDGTIRAVLAAAAVPGADLVELFAEARRSRSLRLEDRRVEELVSGVDRGVGIRVVAGSRSAYAYTNRLDRSALLDAARAAAAAVQGEQQLTVVDLTEVAASASEVRDHPFAADPAVAVELARRADDAARAASPHVRQVTVVYQAIDRRILVATTEGRQATDHQVRTRLAVQVVAARDGVVQTGFEGPGASRGHELFTDRPPEDIAAEAARQAVAMLDARPAPSGEMPVVLWRGDGGVLFHEACGHGLEGDTVARRASVYRGRLGEQLASPLLNGVDDATVPGGWGSYGVDDEGAPAQRTVLFADGVLVGYLTDRRSAAGLELPRSGNARRQSYAHLPLVRMSNSYILPGDTDPADIIADVRRGILCRGLGGGQVDPASGDFVFGMTEAYMIEDGEVTYPVRGANLVGSTPGVLRDIDAVGNDFAVREGICGKDGQSVPVSFGTPTLRIARITIGGTG